jgi:IPT/TIG domain
VADRPPPLKLSLSAADDNRMTLMRSFGLLALVLCVGALPASSALAGKKSSRPSVSSLAPLTVAVGDTLTIRGRNFIPGKKRNSVSFKRDGSPAVTVKAAQATRTRMKVVVPARLAKYLTVSGGVARPSRFRVRVVAGGASSKGYTAPKRSPVIIPAPAAAAGPDELVEPDDGCDTGGVVEGVEGDVGAIAGDLLDALADTCSLDAGDDTPVDDGE